MNPLPHLNPHRLKDPKRQEGEAESSTTRFSASYRRTGNPVAVLLGTAAARCTDVIYDCAHTLPPLVEN